MNQRDAEKRQDLQRVQANEVRYPEIAALRAPTDHGQSGSAIDNADRVRADNR